MEIPTDQSTNRDSNIESFLANLKAGQVALNLFEYIPDVIFWIKNRKGAFIYVNNACLEFGNIDEKESMIGKTDHEIFPVELASIYRSDDLKILSTGEVMKNKAELVPNNTGGVEWRETTKVPLYALDGSEAGTAGISRRIGLAEGRPGPSQHRVMNAIVGAIYKCVDQEIKVADLAQAANISVSTLERIFKQNMGTTPKKFVLQAKISTACERLIRSKKSVSEVGASIGYNDHANFTRAFKKLMGVSPTRYRELYKGSAKNGQKLSDFDEATN